MIIRIKRDFEMQRIERYIKVETALNTTGGATFRGNGFLLASVEIERCVSVRISVYGCVEGVYRGSAWRNALRRPRATPAAEAYFHVMFIMPTPPIIPEGPTKTYGVPSNTE